MRPDGRSEHCDWKALQSRENDRSTEAAYRADLKAGSRTEVGVTAYIERENGAIVGVYASEQQGFAEEFLDDHSPEVVAFLNPPPPPSRLLLAAAAAAIACCKVRERN